MHIHNYCFPLNLLHHLANTQSRYTTSLTDPCHGFTIPAENASSHTSHNGLGSVFQFSEIGQTTQDLVAFGIRSSKFCTQAFCKTQLGLENTGFATGLGSQSLTQGTHGHPEEMGDFLMTTSGSLNSARREYSSRHQSPTGFATRLLGIHNLLEESTSVLEDRFWQACGSSECIDGVKDAHPRTLAMIGHTPC